MKLLLLLLSPAFIFGQKFFNSPQEAKTRFPQPGTYETDCGWQIHEGDEINLGMGTMPDKNFAFIDAKGAKLPALYSNRKAKIHHFYVDGSKKAGYVVLAKLQLGQLGRYTLQIENAIETGEVKVPALEKRNDAALNPGPAPSMADEIKKLKDLLDAGALTQDEFNTAKKKILEK